MEAPQSPEVLRETSLDLSGAGKYGEAFSFAERYAEAVKIRYGENHTKWATALNDLAKLYKAVGRDSEAEALYGRALSTDKLWEKIILTR